MSSRPEVRFLDRSTPPHIVTLVLMAGVAAMNMGAFLPSLPRMTTYFQTDYSVMQLSVSLYLAATAVLQLIIGPLSDRYGRRPVVLICYAIFILASVGCLFATTIEVFLTFRMLQGAVAVGLVLSRAIVRDMVPQREAASMIGYVTMGMALVPMVAPMIGGALDQLFGWQATFIFLIASGISVLALCYADQGETSSGDGKSFKAQVSEYPELLASRRFWGYVFAAAFASGAFFAFLGGAPLVASDVYGLSSFWAGIGFGAPAIGYATGNYISGRFSTHYGINRMIQTGTLITSGGMLLALAISLAGYGSAVKFFGLCTFVGIGNGLVMPNATAGMLSVRPHLAGTASGLGSAILIGGGAALSAFAGVVLGWGTGDAPLLIIMAISACLGYISIRFVVAREKRLATTDPLPD
ncbi:multidrug effflux MFS transporter [uncultured Boseongicola sp.]|jgi:DHA1 family bicyclomycin/chloramphenicol resistance-like MFS transporter|uniref:multidrug effflux MFS transporter n=1 Tax=uncultured Boseongicola sp. TaxID=1648499 RepID=UPI0026021803|nr:multidrug effflux MFS transporter [uncultured Boseongicola sp.]